MTVPYLFETKCHKIGNYVFLMEKDKSGKFIEFTYREVGGLVHSIARALRSLGVKKGSLVGLLSDNRSALMVSDLAIMSLGAADVPRGRDSTAGDVEFIYKTTEVENVIVENLDQLKKLLSVKKNLECLENIIVLDEDRVGDVSTLEAEYGVKIFTYNELINKFKCDEDAELAATIMNSKDDDLATVIFTSGTTGEPKGVMLTQGKSSLYGISSSYLGIFDILSRASPWESGHGNDGCVPKDVLHRLWPARPVRPRLIV